MPIGGASYSNRLTAGLFQSACQAYSSDSTLINQSFTPESPVRVGFSLPPPLPVCECLRGTLDRVTGCTQPLGGSPPLLITST